MKENIEQQKISLLSDKESIRLRYDMYIGGSQNANVLLREIIDNSLDEAAAGYGETIFISNNFNDGGWNLVTDQGRGINIAMSEEAPGETQAYLSISRLHSGSKFSASDTSRIGKNGCGSCCVNVLSEVYVLMSKVTATNYDKSIPEVKALWQKSKSKKDLFYVVITSRGDKKYEGALKLKDAEKMIGVKDLPEEQSTIVLFKPDLEIFDSISAEIPLTNLQYFLMIQEKFYKRKLCINVNGSVLTNTFKPYKEEIMRVIVPADPSYNPQVSVYVTLEADPKMGKTQSYGSVNGLDCGTGFHINLFKNLFKDALKDYYKIKTDEYLLEGLKFGIIVLAAEVGYSSQTKENLKMITKVKPADFAPLVKDIQKLFKKDPDYWDDHVKRVQAIIDSMKNIGAIEKAQKIISAASGNGIYRMKGDLVEGFCDATAPQNERWKCEIFLTEGLSPGGSLKAARTAKEVKYNGVVSLKGKVLDTSDCTADRVMENKEFFTIFSVMGVGIDAHSVIKDAKTPEEAYSILQKKSRFGKLIIATDADEDGLSIQKGILYTIAKFARFLIDFGMVYIAESPIFSQGGKYFYPSDPRIPGTQFCVGMDLKKPFKRYKGLGSLDRDDVYKSFYDPTTRRLIQVTPDYIDYAMGLVEDIEKRKKLLFDKGILANPYNFTDL